MTTAAAEHSAPSPFRGIAVGPTLAHLPVVLSAVETLLAFAIILGVLLRPLALVDKQP